MDHKGALYFVINFFKKNNVIKHPHNGWLCTNDIANHLENQMLKCLSIRLVTGDDYWWCTYKVIPGVCPHRGDGFLADGARYANTTPRCCGRLLCNLLLQLGKHVRPVGVSFWVKSAVSGEWPDFTRCMEFHGSLLWGLKQSRRVLMQCHSKQGCAGNSILLHLEKEKRRLLKCQRWQQRLLVCNRHIVVMNYKIKTHSFRHPSSSSSYNRRAILTYQWQTDASKFRLWLFSLWTL